FTRSGTTWTQQAFLKASNADVFDRFGWSVAVAGERMVVGARYEDGSSMGVRESSFTDRSAARSGAAYLFERRGTAWEETAYMKASNTKADDQFGYSVAIGSRFVAVGAANVDDPGNNAGAAYVYEIPLPPAAPTGLVQVNAT